MRAPFETIENEQERGFYHSREIFPIPARNSGEEKTRRNFSPAGNFVPGRKSSPDV
jgi:hypothetical protein